MRKFTADEIFPISAAPLKDVVIVTDDVGKILSIDPIEDHESTSVERYHGILVPGFVNTHCHLELSHMKGKMPTGTGLISFIQNVVQYRDFAQEVIMDAITRADLEMYDQGIVAVGDISNKLDTAETKLHSRLSYYTFVEAFDFLNDAKSQETYDHYYQVYKGHHDTGGHMKSMVPHAPYSVSPSLFQRINQLNGAERKTVSLHNQETIHENRFFLDKSGEMLRFYKAFELPVDQFIPTGKRSICYALQHMDPHHRTILVHNTVSDAEDVAFASDWGDHLYFASCPNANLYIENRLPSYELFLQAGVTVTLGTDSLASNWQLSILNEMQTIHKYQSFVDLEDLLPWATLNGARALGFDDRLGSFDIGKCPGINLLHHDGCQQGFDLDKAQVRRII